ncbi:MAG: PE-PPE domain-containing protein, partial [Mycobacterium sp.]
MARAGRKDAVKVAIGAAAIGVASSVTAVAVTQPASISASLVDLTALIVVGSSTNPSGAGVEDFFGGRFNQPMYTGSGGVVHVNFWEGPAGIQAALEANAGDDRNVVLSSGWGAANACLLLLAQNPSFSDNTIFVLDNDVARPDGGFGTRYPWFALIGVNPIPTPSDVPNGVTVVNTGYEYDYNSNAPGYVLNPFSAVNALAAYLNTRLNQADIDLPVDENGEPVDCGANTCAITESRDVIPCPDARCSSPDDRITAYVTKRNDTTYVTYTTRELPLTTLVRGIFGDYIADVTAPLLKLAVDFGYYGGNPIPSDPSAYRPARFIPSIGDILTALVKLPGAILDTIAAIFAPLQPRAAQTMSVARQPGPSDEIASITTDLAPNGTDAQLMNILEDDLDAVPGGDGDDDGDGITVDSGSMAPDDGLGTGQPTD